MNKLKKVNQPLKVSDTDLFELDDEIQNYWDHKAESMARIQTRGRRRTFNAEEGR